MVSNSSLGTVSGRNSGPKPQRLTNGPTVISNLPPLNLPKRIDSANTRAKPSDTVTGSRDVDLLKLEISESGM